MKYWFTIMLALVISDSFCQNAIDTSKLKKAIPRIEGVIQVHYFNEFNTNGDTIRDPDGFRILRARLIAEGKINHHIGYQLMIDPRAPEQGGILRDAYIDFDYIENQHIRVGQQKTQFGWENTTSITQLYTVNRAEMSDAVCRGENLRDIGLGLIGHIPINNNLRFENAITFTNGTRMNVAGPFDFNTKMVCWGRVGLQFKKNDLKINCSSSFAFGGLRYLNDSIYTPNDDVYADIWRLGTDVQIENKYAFFAGEFAKGIDKVQDTIYGEPIGYQVQLAIKTKWDIGPIIRYDSAEDEWKVMTLGVYYGLPKDKIRFLCNYVMRGNVSDIPGGHDDRLYIQTQIKF